MNILFKILEEEKPEYLTVTFDVHAPTFRHEMFADYKGTRKPMAEELRQQVPVHQRGAEGDGHCDHRESRTGGGRSARSRFQNV